MSGIDAKDADTGARGWSDWEDHLSIAKNLFARHGRSIHLGQERALLRAHCRSGEPPKAGIRQMLMASQS
jgi:hypothetical protein